MSNRDDDIKQLKACLEEASKFIFSDEDVEKPSWFEPFSSMLDSLDTRRQLQLTEKQRAWVHGVHERLFDEPQYSNDWSAGKVPRGSYGKTPTPEVLKVLPKKPPTKRKENI